MTPNEWDDWGNPLDEVPPDVPPIDHGAQLEDAAQDNDEGARSSWAPVDLAPILDGTYTPPTPELLPRDDGLCLLYPGLVHSIHGESESGKSLVAQAESARLIMAGEPVLYLDFESDPGAVVDRMRMFGAQTEQLRQHLHYVRPEVDLRQVQAVADWRELLTSRHYRLAVIDGVTEALTLFGYATKENDDITLWHRIVPKRIADTTGAAVVLIDHVTKDAQTRGRFAIGGQAKLATLSGASYSVEVLQPLGRGLRGVLSLRVGKDRPGFIRQRCGNFRHSDRTQQAAQIVLDATVEPALYEVTAAPQHEDSSQPFRPTALMAKISKELEAAPNPLSANTIEKLIPGKVAHVRAALACLVKEGYVTEQEGPRRARMHTTAKPYREVDDPKSDRYRPDRALVEGEDEDGGT